MADWIPGTVAGLAAGVGGTFLRMWRAEPVQDFRMTVLERKLTEHMNQYREERSGLIADMRQAAESFQKTALCVASMASELTALNKVTTDAIRGILARQEEHAREIAALQGRLVKH